MAQELSSEYSIGELERAATEFVDRKLDAKTIVSSVFPRKNDCTVFLDRLRSLAETPGCTVSLNGRALREAIGFTTYDYSKSIQSEAIIIQQSGDRVDPKAHLLRPLLPALLKNTDRFTRPDLDFTVTGQSLDIVVETFQDSKFKVNDDQAFNGVRVVEVLGENGVASFVDPDQSWYSQLPAPKILTISAPLETDPKQESYFHLHTRWGNLYLYPLACPGLGMNDLSDPTSPKSMAATARALMLAATVSGPDQKPLRIPMTGFRGAIYDAVEEFVPILKKIGKGELEENPYRSAIRSMSLALLLIVRRQETLDILTQDHFFSHVVAAHKRGVGVHASRKTYGPEGRLWRLGAKQFA